MGSVVQVVTVRLVKLLVLTLLLTLCYCEQTQSNLPVAETPCSSTSGVSALSIPHQPVEVEWEIFEATAYVDRGITKAGTMARSGVVAVDPDVIPLGSVVQVESDYPGITGYYLAEDTGGAVKGKIIDVWLPDYDEAIKFGRRPVKVKVYLKEEGGYYR